MKTANGSARLSRRSAADRHAEHGRQAVRPLGRLYLRAFRRRRHGHRHQQAGKRSDFPRPSGAARHRAGARRARPSRRRRQHARPSRRAGGDRPRLRAAFLRFLPRERHAADRRGRLPDGDAGNPARHLRRARARPRAAGARLCRLGAGTARIRDPGERLAALPGRSRASSSTTTSTPNTTARSPRSASSRPCCRWKPATPDAFVRLCEAQLARATAGRRRTICCTICGVIGRP